MHRAVVKRRRKALRLLHRGRSDTRRVTRRLFAAALHRTWRKPNADGTRASEAGSGAAWSRPRFVRSSVLPL